MAKLVSGGLMAAILAVGAATLCLAQASPDGMSFTVHLDSEDSWRSYYQQFGILFDDEATQAVRAKFSRKCYIDWSRRMGNHPRPVKFLGMAYLQDDPSHELRPICMFSKPNTDAEAEKLCEALGRTLTENMPVQLEIRCAPP